jgi:tetratricopeptide (TPR) repeat protein
MRRTIIAALLVCVGLSVADSLPDFDKLWDFANPVKTESTFSSLLRPAVGSGDIDYYAQLLTQVARAQGLQGKFDQAHASLDQADFLITDSLPVARIRYLLERGRLFNSAGNTDTAKTFFTQAWNMADIDHDLPVKARFYAIDAAHMMAIVEPAEQQADWFIRAIELAADTTIPGGGRWLGALYNNAGWTMHDLGRYEEALVLFQKGLDWRTEQGQLEPTLIAKYAVGRCLRSLDRIDEALEIQLSVVRQRNAEALDPDGYVFEEIGELHLARADTASAVPQFAKAYNLLSQDSWLAENEPGRIARIKELGKVQE